MSVYTEIVISCNLKPDTPDTTIAELRYWLGLARLNNDEPSKWYYDTFDEYSHSRPGALQRSLEVGSESYALTLRAKIKNYDRQIYKLLSFLVPHSSSHGFVGYIQDEVDEYPTLIFFQEENNVIYREIKEVIDISSP